METGAALPVFLLIAVVLGMAMFLLSIGPLVNAKRVGPVTKMPYESGMDPVHDTRRRFDVRFHLLAIAFLVFDVELLFLYPWAVAMRPATEVVATSGGTATGETVAGATQGINAAVAEGLVSSRDFVFVGAMIFIALLALGFIYDWRKGVFRWR